jgi:hypothetical protein
MTQAPFRVVHVCGHTQVHGKKDQSPEARAVLAARGCKACHLRQLAAKHPEQATALTYKAALEDLKNLREDLPQILALAKELDSRLQAVIAHPLPSVSLMPEEARELARQAGQLASLIALHER